jgi:hypothetical protein
MSDEDSLEPDAMPAPRLRRSFRFGVLHARSGAYKPFVSIGLSRDGGVFAAPVDLPGTTWTHGPVVASILVADQPNLATTTERPKLHNHRSGIVRASLSGVDIETATSRFTPLPGRRVNTFLSIVAARSRELPEREFRRGDVSTIEGVWPAAVGLSLSIIQSTVRRPPLGKTDELEPMGLILETPSQFVVDLTGYGHTVQVLGQVTTSDEQPPGYGPSVTVAAYPEPADSGQGGPLSAHALWNSNARNPLFGYVADFLWEADRHSRRYRAAYVRRFNRLPPWHRASGTRRERAIVLVMRASQWLRRGRRIRRARGRDASFRAADVPHHPR